MLKLISLDCEYNQPSGKLIQVGAVLFRPSGEILSTFESKVNPGEPLNPEIVELTRIQPSMVVGAPDATQVAHLLTGFKTTSQCNSIGVVWGAGRVNDISEVYRQAGIESAFRVRVIDVKGVYTMLANQVSAKLRDRAGLEVAMGNVGLRWDETYGLPHDALADAHNTARIYCRLANWLGNAYQIHQAP